RYLCPIAAEDRRFHLFRRIHGPCLCCGGEWALPYPVRLFGQGRRTQIDLEFDRLGPLI
ncbi:hypothetical protein LTR94_032996, partial [Friedmanniomyces endolithicus]